MHVGEARVLSHEVRRRTPHCGGATTRAGRGGARTRARPARVERARSAGLPPQPQRQLARAIPELARPLGGTMRVDIAFR